MTTTTLTRPVRVPSRAVPSPPSSRELHLSQLIGLVGSLTAATLLAYVVLALPNRLMLSDYVHVPGGLEPFVGGLLALAVAILAVARVAATAGAPAAAVLRVCAAAAVLTAAFPTDAARVAVMSLSGQIHRWAAFVVFVGLPFAGWLLVRGSTTRPARVVRWLAGVSAAATAMTLLLHPISPVADVIAQPGWEGGFERMLAATDVLIVGAIAAAGDRLVRLRPIGAN